MMSTPASTCLRTTSPTALRTPASKAWGSGAVPASIASRVAVRSQGRGRLPVWVVRMRSVLRFMAVSPSLRPDAVLRSADAGPIPWRLASCSRLLRLHHPLGVELGNGRLGEAYFLEHLAGMLAQQRGWPARQDRGVAESHRVPR